MKGLHGLGSRSIPGSKEEETVAEGSHGESKNLDANDRPSNTGLALHKEPPPEHANAVGSQIRPGIVEKDNFERLLALGKCLGRLSRADQSRLVSAADTSGRSVSELFDAQAERLLSRTGGNRNYDFLCASGETDVPFVFPLGEMNYNGHNGGLSIWRSHAYPQGYYHRRLGETPSSTLSKIWDEQPMLHWSDEDQKFEVKRGAFVQRHLLAEVSKDASEGRVQVYRGMSRFEALLFELGAGLKEGKLPEDWQTSVSGSLDALRDDLVFAFEYQDRAGNSEKADAAKANLDRFDAYAADLRAELNAGVEPPDVQGFLERQLQHTLSTSSFGAYFLTPDEHYANRFATGRIARFAFHEETLARLNGQKKLYLGVEHSPELGFGIDPRPEKMNELTKLLMDSFVSAREPEPMY